MKFERRRDGIQSRQKTLLKTFHCCHSHFDWENGVLLWWQGNEKIWAFYLIFIIHTNFTRYLVTGFKFIYTKGWGEKGTKCEDSEFLTFTRSELKTGATLGTEKLLSGKALLKNFSFQCCSFPFEFHYKNSVETHKHF